MISLVPFTDAFLDLSWYWLNDPEVKALTNTGDFTRDDQNNWFDSFAAENNFLVWGIQSGEVKIGVCGFKKITGIDCEYWGYIGLKSYWGKGIGTTVMKQLEQRALEMNLKSIWLQVLHDNARAIRLYEKLGYVVEQKDSKLLYMRKEL